ncbi:hypothetical protein M9H77_08453 [Catharanthus roseus]|uniref:Uncharacterized protein n=1 Tax=Catharanthus roseus TaxID=4058 RepID=A0ACC0BY84_CATRO|nr:hypothetical protein M9H77_08453 [Catharanthus roseus]
MARNFYPACHNIHKEVHCHKPFDGEQSIEYSRDDLSLSDVKNALKSKDLDLQKENKSNGENLFVRGRIDRREPPSHHFKSRSKSREKSKVLDYGSSFHMTPNKHWFSEFKHLNQGKVFMGNNQVCDIKGIGNIFIKMHDGVTRKLTE